MPYSGWILGSKCHPYNWKKICNPTKITFKILPLSKWQICGQIPQIALPGEAGNLLIKNSKWQWTVTYNIGNKIQLKGKLGQAYTNTSSYGDTHLMEASLSRRDTLFKRISTTFKKITSGQQYGNQKSCPKYLLSSGFYFKTRS